FVATYLSDTAFRADEGFAMARPAGNVGYTAITLGDDDFETFVAYVACGDGSVGASEGCDDGGTTPGDGCDASCAIEPGYDCPSSGGACTEIDECDPNPCMNGGTCTDLLADYSCA